MASASYLPARCCWCPATWSRMVRVPVDNEGLGPRRGQHRFTF